MNKKQPLSKKVLALGGVVLVGAGALLGALAFPKTVTETVTDTQIVEVTKNVTIEVPVEVEVIKEIEVEKIVEVDNGDLAFFLERAEDKDVIDDAKDAVAEYKAEDAAIKMAFNHVEEEMDDVFDTLEDKGIITDEDEVEVVRVYDDFEDVNILKSDFDDEEYKFELRYKIEDLEEEEKKYILVKVEVEDGEAKILKVSEE